MNVTLSNKIFTVSIRYASTIIIYSCETKRNKTLVLHFTPVHILLQGNLWITYLTTFTSCTSLTQPTADICTRTPNFSTRKLLTRIQRAVTATSLEQTPQPNNRNVTTIDSLAIREAKPYSEVPGPKPLPILGNTWRLLPVIGQYTISDVARLSEIFHQEYGKIVKLSGLIGRPDLLFVYDADEIEKVYRQEGPTPFRPSMPCLVKYKSVVRRDFFEDIGGVVGVWVCISSVSEFGFF